MISSYKGAVMEINEIIDRISYVRNYANLSARELSFRLGMSPQYVAQIENGRITLSVEKLLQILEICNFPIERFFSNNIDEFNQNTELVKIVEDLPLDKKQHLIGFLKN